MANWKKILLGGAALAAAPFTGGLSIPLLGSVGTGLAVGGLSTALGGIGDKGGKNTAAGSQTTTPQALPTFGGADDALKASSEALTAKSHQLGDQGDKALNQVLDYYGKLTSGDPNAVLDATKAQRGRVIDQYDTARKNILEFNPRGGGTTSTLAQSRLDEASALSDATSTATGDAAKIMAGLGPQLEGLGLSAQQLADADVGTIINAVLAKQQLAQGDKSLDLQKRGQNISGASGFGEAIGNILGLILTRGKAGGGGGGVPWQGVPYA